ncbi:YybH family protein [Tateyamaria sp. SN3-11]|uniref:YybH family protein n=1 Tax=Tateyamaria sp. SN3-11 TaxID=3092147 RepID=UPI0039EB8DAD
MTTPSNDVAEAISANNRDFEKAFEALNAEGLAAVYTSNGMLMPPNSPIIQGRANMTAFWQSMIDMGIAGVELNTVELDQVGDSVNEVGKFKLKTADGSIADSGKFIVVWKQEAGKWLWHHDIFSSENAA